MNIDEVENWDEVSDWDLYQMVDENRETWKLLAEQEVLQSHFMYQVVRERTVRSLYFLNLFVWDANPFGGPDAPITDNLMTWENHKNIIDMFVKKDPTKSLANQSKIKTRLILYPRGTLKTTWGELDVVQWVLLDYKIRILVLSASDDLAAAIVDEIRGFFVLKETEPTLMNLFWPEHCLLEKDLGPSGSYTSPAWTALQIKRREPTIMSRGLTATVSGFHFEVFHADDAVETRNSGTEEICISVKKKYGITRKILRTFGYTNLLGTRYHEADLYGDIIAKSELGEFHVEEFSIGEKKISNPGKGVEILIGSAMTLKPDAEMELSKYNLAKQTWFRKAGPNGVHLLMPKVLTYDTLLVGYEDDPEAFETQMRQNVLPPTQQMFTRELILKNTVNWMDLPLYGRVTHTWDLNGGKGKKDNDLCVGSACLWDAKGFGYIIDLVAANYPNPISMAQAIVQFACKHHPDTIVLEDSAGVRMLEPTIWAEADKTNDFFVKQLVRRIYWRQVDTTKDAKKNRIAALYPLVLYGRLKFSSTLPEREKLIEQFIRPVTKNSKNDIPDCISFQTMFLPDLPQSPEEQKRRAEEIKARREQEIGKNTWEMIFKEDWNNQYKTYVVDEEGQLTDLIRYETPIDEVGFRDNRPYMDNEGLDNVLGFGLIG